MARTGESRTDPPLADPPPSFRPFISPISWTACGRGKSPNADIAIGHNSTRLCHLGNIAHRTGKKLTFDAATETFPGDDEANALLGREYSTDSPCRSKSEPANLRSQREPIASRVVLDRPAGPKACRVQPPRG